MAKIEKVLVFFSSSQQINYNDKNTQNEQTTKNELVWKSITANTYLNYKCLECQFVNFNLLFLKKVISENVNDSDFGSL